MEFIGTLAIKALVWLIVASIYVGSALGWLLLLFMLRAAIKDARYEWQYRSRWDAMGSMAGALFCLLFLVLIPWAVWSAPRWQ